MRLETTDQPKFIADLTFKMVKDMSTSITSRQNILDNLGIDKIM